MRIKIVVLLAFIIGSVHQAHAALSLSGTLSHGQKWTITDSASGLSTHPGLSGIQQIQSNIQAGTPGTDVSLPAGWTSTPDSGTQYTKPHYSDEYPRGASTQSIKAHAIVGYGVNSGFYYDMGVGGVYKLYASIWVYALPISASSSPSQWKFFIVSPEASADQKRNSFWGIHWMDGVLNMDPGSKNPYCMVYCCSATSTPSYTCQSDGTTSQPPWACFNNTTYLYNPASNLKGVGIGGYGVDKRGRWYFIQIFAKASEGGTANGQVIVTSQETGDSQRYFINLPATITRTTGEELWRYIYWLGYFGNGVTEMYVHYTDPYVQTGSYARVELADSDVYANITHREVQKPTLWQADKIEIEAFNRGSFAENAAGLTLWITLDDGTQYSIPNITLGSPPVSYEARLILGSKCDSDSVFKNITSGSTDTFDLTAESGRYIKISGTCGGSLSAAFATSATYATGTMSANCTETIECPIMPGIPFSK